MRAAIDALAPSHRATSLDAAVSLARASLGAFMALAVARLSGRGLGIVDKRRAWQRSLFGTAALVALPLLDGLLLHLSPTAFGTWVGASVHEVAQVVSAATSAGPSGPPRLLAMASVETMIFPLPTCITPTAVPRLMGAGGVASGVLA